MSWIQTIPFEQASGKLRRLYERVAGPENNVDNILQAHSLRPHTLEGHMALYKNVLHHPDNSFPKKVLEALGTYVSLLNECDYCVKHHFAGLVRLVGEAHGAELMNAMKKHDFAGVLDDDQDVLFRYAKALTETPAKCQEEFNAMREAGYRDGEILEVNQVVSYFNYANRTVLGLGVVTEGDVLGLSPGDMDDDGNWTHQ